MHISGYARLASLVVVVAAAACDQPTSVARGVDAPRASLQPSSARRAFLTGQIATIDGWTSLTRSRTDPLTRVHGGHSIVRLALDADRYYHAHMADTNPPSPLHSNDAAAEIRAEREASNAAIARRDAKGTIANMLPGYRGTLAQSQAHSSREAVYAALKKQFADPNMLGYVRTPMVIEVSSNSAAASEYGRWVGRHRTEGGVEEMSGTYYATWHRNPSGWRINSEAFVALALARRDNSDGPAST